MTNLKQLINQTKIKLFTKKIMFFGIMSYRYLWKIYPMDETIEGMVKFDLVNCRETCDGSIHLNENILTRPDYSFENLAYLISHEVMHILNKHGVRGKNINNRAAWALATDHVIERELMKMKDSFKPYQNNYNYSEKLEKEIPDCTAEQAYEWFNKKIENNTVKITFNFSNGQTGNTDTGEDGTVTIKFPDGKKYTVNLNPGGKTKKNEDGDVVTDSDYDRKIDRITSSARAIIENIKNRGDTASELMSYLSEILKVEIPWERVLEKAIKTNVIMIPEDRSWSKPNKYYFPHQLYLPGENMEEDHDNTGTLLITVDTSGSVSDTELKKFSSIIEKSMDHFHEIVCIIHDVTIAKNEKGEKQIKHFNKDDINQFYKFIKTEGYGGRGGTSHKYAFDYIEKEYWNDNEKRESLSMVIVLSDMESDIELIMDNYKFITNNTPIAFVRTGKRKIENMKKNHLDIIIK